MTEIIANKLCQLFRDYGEEDYLGEPVSKTVHSLQCGTLAENDGQPVPVVLGAFLHDIGHLIGEKQGLPKMTFENTHLGTVDHASIGADFLTQRGFQEDVTDVVRFHVDAKRFLCFSDPNYFSNLSWASVQTLKLQGGPMNQTQAADFRQNPRWQIILKTRGWDEEAKDPNWTPYKSLDYFRMLILNYLENCRSY